MTHTDTPTARRYLLRRAAIGLLALWFAATVVFLAIHLGPRAPGDASAPTAAQERALAEQKAEYGLDRPLAAQYVDYLTDLATFDFGQTWSASEAALSGTNAATPVVDALTGDPLWVTLWLWAWAVLLTVVVGATLAATLWFSPWSPSLPGATVAGALLRAFPVVLLLPMVRPLLLNSEELLFGFDWGSFLVDRRTVYGPIPLDGLWTVDGALVATKAVLPVAAVLSLAMLPAGIRLGAWAIRNAERARWREGAVARGVTGRRRVARGLKQTGLPALSLLPFNASLLMGATLYVANDTNIEGLGHTFILAVSNGDYVTLQTMLFLAVLVLVLVRLVEEVLFVLVDGTPTRHGDRAVDYWTGSGSGAATGAWTDEVGSDSRLRALPRRATTGLVGRVRAAPLPAVVWVGAGAVLLALELGAVLSTLEGLSFVGPLPDLPTLLSRSHLPNAGYHTPDGGWTGTAFGLPAGHAWALRAGLTYLYAAAWVAWLVVGYRVYRTTYREADRTPFDAAAGRFRRSRWATFGFVVVFTVVVAAIFAPTLAATEPIPGDAPEDEEITVEYYDDRSDSVRSIAPSTMRTLLRAKNVDADVAPLEYGHYGQFHPLGTTDANVDLLNWFLTGVRTFVLQGTVGATVALVLTALTAVASRLSRPVESGAAFAAETVFVLPTVPFALFAVEQFTPWYEARGWLASVLLAVILGVLLWPALWRTLRAPFEAALGGNWLDAAGSAGMDRSTAVRRHVLPRLAGYAVTFALLAFVGVSIAVVTIGHMWEIPTAYLRQNALGYGSTQIFAEWSWQTTAIPVGAGVLIVLGFLALADGVRHAVDPTGEDGTAAPAEAASAGGAG